MDGPARGDHRLFVVHDDMPCLLRLAHIVNDKCIVRHVKVQVDFHSSVMCMRRHGVPHASRQQAGHSHSELAALHLSRNDVLVDDPVVRVLKSSQLHLVLILDDDNAGLRLSFRLDVDCRISHMCRRAVQIELRRCVPVFALEGNVLRASSDIHAFPCVDLVDLSVHCNDPVAADIDDAHLSSLKKILGPELISRRQLQFSAHRHRRACDDTVNVAVDQIDLICLKQILDQKFLPESVGRVMLHVPR